MNYTEKLSKILKNATFISFLIWLHVISINERLFYGQGISSFSKNFSLFLSRRADDLPSILFYIIGFSLLFYFVPSILLKYFSGRGTIGPKRYYFSFVVIIIFLLSQYIGGIDTGGGNLQSVLIIPIAVLYFIYIITVLVNAAKVRKAVV